ncbi:hypothetical protein XENOCAPTIV_010280 [Xenoophorus captivus]|uniref:Uncharacterized protein n=1 Tax=Xenoophorus captivus TaxID=1517983 RepID=A0ABV0RC67_9TELE
MHKAFWDCLETQLKEDPPSYEHAIKLLGEIKETLLSFLLPGHGRLRSRIEEVLDLPLIQQQAENGALDISQLWDHASNPFPETVLMDQVRFLEMQQETERLVLLSSVLLIVYTTTGEAISGLPGLMETLKNTVGVMLAEMHMP